MPTTREDSVLFKEIWRSLHRNGWTSKPPALRSLDTSYRYVKPGCNPDGDDGTDFFPVLPGNDFSILSRSSLAPSVGEQERTNAGTEDVIIDKESDEGDTAGGQRSSGVLDAEKGFDLHGDCASSCSADEERDDGFPRCRTETSAPVGGSSSGEIIQVGQAVAGGIKDKQGRGDPPRTDQTNPIGNVAGPDTMKPNLLVLESVEVAADVAFEAVWEGVEYVVKEESVGVPAGVTFEAVVELFSIQLPMFRVPMIRVPMVLALMT
ncbi:hypothetical protein PF007_g14310 [Phytophthora fragariae]|nr:hypothetical protein PF009_g12103 [Phytophthora fragariae]KAE9103700.1 hypothetical protein PF007_g14310 [Phytophthora fragariae]KAE9213156.1 hypothetical protein PF004_g15429 [Phytophthora fragariae]